MGLGLVGAWGGWLCGGAPVVGVCAAVRASVCFCVVGVGMAGEGSGATVDWGRLLGPCTPGGGLPAATVLREPAAPPRPTMQLLMPRERLLHFPPGFALLLHRTDLSALWGLLSHTPIV